MDFMSGVSGVTEFSSPPCRSLLSRAAFTTGLSEISLSLLA
jgi:hypothetical protein